MAKRAGGVWSMKRRLKRWLSEERRRFITRFFPFDAKALAANIAKLGISAGDTVMVHSAFDRFVGFCGGPADAIDVLQNAVGPSGTLLMPTLPFRGSAIDFARRGELTDLVDSPSANGLLSEIFRRMPGVVRSVHPTHPVAAWGANAAAMVENHHRATTPCGRDSPFLRLLDCDGKILFLGARAGTMTFFHSVEEVLEPRMPSSPFTAEVFELQTRDAAGNVWPTSTRLFDPALSKRRDLGILANALRRSGHWREGKVGRLRLIVVSARDVLATCEKLAGAGRYCYR